MSVALPELISALSFALDLTEGAVPGHALRCCVLGMRLAEAMDVPKELLTPLYYALQLKDVGCSNNAARMTQVVGGDDRAVKAIAKLADWTSKFRVDARTILSLWRNVLPDDSLVNRARRIAMIGLKQNSNNREMISLRCERGASILRKLDLGEDAADAVHRLDEHWRGSGYPSGLHGEDIPLLARICSVAQNLDVFAIADGMDSAIEILKKRSGTWFDPKIVNVVERLHEEGRLWTHCEPNCLVERTRQTVMRMMPGEAVALGEEHIDAICEAFADVVDAKSPFTAQHSRGVAEVAEAIALEMKLLPERVTLVRRAALLHDLGKLGVSNTILDKQGALTPSERMQMQEHPYLSQTILERVSCFAELALVAGQHHERLDGSGYPLGLRASEIALESRIVAMADSFGAMAEHRPYRDAVALDEILVTLRLHAPERLDFDCFQALKRVVLRWNGVKPDVFNRPADDGVCKLPPARVSAATPAQQALSA